MSTVHHIMATAGHVDHGKSALVLALTGTNPDRLPEEKARGITIELGFAHLELPNQDDPDGLLHDVGVVDVPGHEDFVKNMVAGVGSVDLALLIVAADDGWMPQTEEHLQILDYLGVAHAVVALTKCDLVEDRSAVISSLKAHLADSPFATAPIVPTSVVTGEGLAELKVALASTLAAVPPAADSGKPRLPVDRAFTVAGVGTIVTGTLTGGVLGRSQSVVIQPGGLTARIRSLQRHGREIQTAGPGMRTALSIPEAPLASGAPNGVARGHVITVAALGGGVRVIDVLLRKSGRVANLRKSAVRPLKDGTRIRLHHGSTNVAGYVVLAAPLEPGGQAIAQLRLEEPIFVLAGDHFILRDWPEQATLAGGVILDVDASPERFRTESQQALLRQRAEALLDPGLWIETQLRRDRVQPRASLLVRSRFSQSEIDAAVSRFVGAGHLVDLGEQVVWGAWWNEMRQRVIERTRQEHAARPERLGLALSELRSLLVDELTLPTLFDLLIAEVCRGELVRDHTLIRHRTHRPALPLPLQAAGNRVRALLAAKPLEPPARKEVAPDAPSQQALRFLLESGEAVALGADLVFLTESMMSARDRIRQHIARHGPSTASDLRQALGTSRRVIIPLLEQLDREGFTVRQGDLRKLR